MLVVILICPALLSASLQRKTPSPLAFWIRRPIWGERACQPLPHKTQKGNV